MPGFEHGFRRGIWTVVVGVVIVMVLNALSRDGPIDPSQVVLVKLLMIGNVIFAVLAAKYWGNEYLFGWLCGIGILAMTGLASAGDLAIYLGIPGLFFIARATKILPI